MKARPYVGITGPVDLNEVNAIITEFDSAGYNMQTSHIPMLGYLVSNKTLNGLPTNNLRYPLFSELPALLTPAYMKVLTMIHYNTNDKSTLTDQISAIFTNLYANNLCRALQMNIVWPDIVQVNEIKSKFPEMKVVFQASGSAMAGKSPSQIASGIARYGESINYVLIDPSGGCGLEFDIASSLALYNELNNICPQVTVGFAGGLTGQNVEKRIQSLISATKSCDFCIDAEGGLRDKLSDEYGDDILNMEKVKSYLQASSHVLR